jgi:hypothetical protein
MVGLVGSPDVYFSQLVAKQPRDMNTGQDNFRSGLDNFVHGESPALLKLRLILRQKLLTEAYNVFLLVIQRTTMENVLKCGTPKQTEYTLLGMSSGLIACITQKLSKRENQSASH